MEIAIAIAHIVGAVTTVFILSLVLGMLILLRNEADGDDHDSDKPTATAAAVQFPRRVARRSSAALIQQGWAWIGLAVMLLILAEVFWMMFTQSLGAAKFAWSIVAVFVGCELAGHVCSMAWRWLMSSPQAPDDSHLSDTV